MNLTEQQISDLSDEVVEKLLNLGDDGYNGLGRVLNELADRRMGVMRRRLRSMLTRRIEVIVEVEHGVADRASLFDRVEIGVKDLESGTSVWIDSIQDGLEEMVACQGIDAVARFTQVLNDDSILALPGAPEVPDHEVMGNVCNSAEDAVIVFAERLYDYVVFEAKHNLRAPETFILEPFEFGMKF